MFDDPMGIARRRRVRRTPRPAAGAPVAESTVVDAGSAERRVSHDPSIILHPGYVAGQEDPTTRLVIEVADRDIQRAESEIDPVGMNGMGFIWASLLEPLVGAAAGVGTSLLQKKAAEEAAKDAKKAAEKAAAAALKLAKERRKAEEAAAKKAAALAVASGAQRPSAIPWWVWALGVGGIVLLGSGLFLRGRQTRARDVDGRG